MSPKCSGVQKSYTFLFDLWANLAKSCSGWLPVHIPHKIEEKTLRLAASPPGPPNPPPRSRYIICEPWGRNPSSFLASHTHSPASLGLCVPRFFFLGKNLDHGLTICCSSCQLISAVCFSTVNFFLLREQEFSSASDGGPESGEPATTASKWGLEEQRFWSDAEERTDRLGDRSRHRASISPGSCEWRSKVTDKQL
jgi:hypothetical protein